MRLKELIFSGKGPHSPVQILLPRRHDQEEFCLKQRLTDFHPAHCYYTTVIGHDIFATWYFRQIY